MSEGLQCSFTFHTESVLANVIIHLDKGHSVKGWAYGGLNESEPHRCVVWKVWPLLEMICWNRVRIYFSIFLTFCNFNMGIAAAIFSSASVDIEV